MISFIVFLCLLGHVWTNSSDKYIYETKFINVPIDHYSFVDNSSFKLRYLLSSQHHVKGGPIFIYAGNEGDITRFANNTGFLFELAPTFNALIVFIEHRYYGDSLPFGKDSLTSLAHLKYLTTSQALKDFVYVIEDLKKTYLSTMISNDTYPIVAFGGSYGGMLAAWLRMKYPNSVIGSVASSAPIWIFEGLTPCEKFYKMVTDIFRRFGGDYCAKTISLTWNAIRTVTNSTRGKQHLSQTWKLCKPLQRSSDVERLLNWLKDIYVNLAMSNYPYPTDFLAPLPAYPVKIFCDKITSNKMNDTEELLDSLGKALEIYTNYTGKNKCKNTNTSYDFFEEYAWSYQTCTEMVMAFCSTDQDMFDTKPWNMKIYSEECYKKFKVHPLSTQWPVIEYSGKNLKYFSNIVFINGLIDPWAVGGVLHNVSHTIWSVNITDGAHHVDLRGSEPADNNYVIEARQFVMRAIKKWLNVA